MGLPRDIYKTIFNKEKPEEKKYEIKKPVEKPEKKEFSLLGEKERYISMKEAKRRSVKSPYQLRKEHKLKTQKQAKASMERATKRIAELTGKKGKYLSRKDLERGLEKWKKELVKDKNYRRKSYQDIKTEEIDRSFLTKTYNQKQRTKASGSALGNIFWSVFSSGKKRNNAHKIQNQSFLSKKEK